MNILDRHYPEISFKTDAEDLEILVSLINFCAEGITIENDISVKIGAVLLKEIRYKFNMKIEQKRGTTKTFLIKLKAYQIFSLYNLLLERQSVFSNTSYEFNCVLKYKNQFHQKLISL